MSTFKKTLHSAVLPVTGLLTKLLPDRIPVTFTGAGASRELCEAIGQLGARRVLVVSDAGLVQIRLVERITDALTAAGVAWTVYDGVEPDPTFAQVDAGFARLREEDCDAVLAVGGGSPMDAAKVIAAMATNGGHARKLEGMMKVKEPTLPLFAIPTTAGTGSEVTYAAVVSDSETHTKTFFADPKLMPSMTALDPALMTGLPPHVTAATGMDALTHAVESYIATTASPQTRAWATTAVRLIFENLPTAFGDGGDLAARKAMALASYYAGLAFTRTSVGYVHAIAHAFGAYYRTPHGWANAVALPHVLEFSREEAAGELAKLAAAIGLEFGDQADGAARFIEAVRDLKERVAIPETLEDLRRADIPAIAAQAVAEAHMNYPVPRIMSEAECGALLQRMLGTSAA